MSALEKSPDAFRTISEVAEDLDVPQHVLRFWESKFAQVKPLKRAGGRRYYRPEDIDMLRGIRTLLYSDGFTIKGVQRVFREQGLRYVIETGRMAAREQIAGEDRPLPVSRSHSGTASSHTEPEIIVEEEPVEEEVSVEPEEEYAPQAEVSPTVTPIVASNVFEEEPLLLDTPIDEPPEADGPPQGLAPHQRETLSSILEELEDLKTRLSHAKSQAHRMAEEEPAPEQVEIA